MDSLIAFYKLMETFFFNFKFVFDFFWPKTEKISKEYRVVNIDQSAMCYIPMDSSRHAVQTNGKTFLKFRNYFLNYLQFF